MPSAPDRSGSGPSRLLAIALWLSSVLGGLAALDPATMRPGAWTVAFLSLIPVAAAFGVLVWFWGARWDQSRMMAVLVLLDALVVVSVLGNLDRRSAAINLFLLMPPALYAAASFSRRLVRVHEVVLVAACVAAIGSGSDAVLSTATTSLIPLTGLLTASEMVLFQRRSLERALTEVHTLSITDPLTGLLNRRGLHRGAAERELTAQSAVLLLDVDRFKAVNDLHGHAVGDEVLVALAQGLRSALRPGDLVARTGGEEFLVLLGDSAPGLYDRAEQLRAAVRRVLGRWNCTVSLGAARVQPTGDPVGDLAEATDRADRALYTAKSSGRDRTAIDC
ncbi:MAG: GGDEF domain-containing protein [Actinobacteria bacterium]|nr:GGDEF domain-containing protein [Actinomycetota bacterium]